MPITTLPPAPDILDPANFPTEASAFVAALPVLVSETNAALLTFGPGAPYCTVGGTANALTLTTGMSLTSLVQGQAFLFVPSVTNTGAATANVDGLGAVTLQTVKSTALPAGYLRAGRITVAVRDGSVLKVGRDIETDNNANGYFVRFDANLQVCWAEVTTSSSAGVTHTWPAAFADTTYRIVHGVYAEMAAVSPDVNTRTTTTINVNAYSSGTTRVVAEVDLLAFGPWY